MSAPNGTIPPNGNGKRWYDDHIRIIAFGAIVSTLVLLSPFFIMLFNNTGNNAKALSSYKLEVREKYVTYDEYCRTIDKLWIKLEDIHEDVEAIEHGGGG